LDSLPALWGCARADHTYMYIPYIYTTVRLEGDTFVSFGIKGKTELSLLPRIDTSVINIYIFKYEYIDIYIYAAQRDAKQI
jgi:hypothetical protein